jgi:hypothetical protein
MAVVRNCFHHEIQTRDAPFGPWPSELEPSDLQTPFCLSRKQGQGSTALPSRPSSNDIVIYSTEAALDFESHGAAQS